jgi:hypothetical protein
MSKCSRLNCPESPSFECVCRSERKLFCNNDLILHLQDTSITHSPQPMAKTTDPRVLALLISTLESCRSEVQSQKKQVMEDFSRSLLALEERGKAVLRQLSDYEKNLAKAISDLKTAPNALCESNMKKTLSLSFADAQSECQSWTPCQLSLNSQELKTSIRQWADISEDFEYIFTTKAKPAPPRSKSTVDSAYPAFRPEKVDLKGPEEAKTFVHASSLKSPPPADPPNPRHSVPPSPASSAKTLTCSKKHPLTWSTTVPFQYFNQSKSFWIECDGCHKSFSSSCWHCAECSFDLCENCGNSQGKPAPKLKCDKNHELLWRPETDMYYEFKQQGHNFRCRECRGTKDQAHWHCRSCDYDICQDCGVNHNYNPLTGKIKCKAGHPLVQTATRVASIGGMILVPKCSCCSQQFNGDAFTCGQCNYMICPDCYRFFTFPTAGHPIFRCQSGHLLRWAPTSQFSCDSCMGTFTQERYRCKECNADMCMRCANIMMDLVMENPSKTHGPNNHPLVWTMNPGGPTDCGKCGQTIRRIGMYRCKECPSAYCMLCYNDPNRPIPARNTGNPQADLASLLLLSSLLRNS